MNTEGGKRKRELEEAVYLHIHTGNNIWNIDSIHEHRSWERETERERSAYIYILVLYGV